MKIFTEPDQHITTFKKFVEIVEKRHSPTTETTCRWIFRGHSNSEFKLIPGIGRLLGTERFPTVKILLDMEKSSFLQFELLGYKDIRESNRFMQLAVAQHHGLKTRLLDWTFAPFVALFFAVEDESETDGAYYAFNTQNQMTSIIRRTEHPFDDLGAPYQYLTMPAITPRIAAQSGLFQLFRNPTAPLENAPYLEKFIIPAEAKHDIKIDLNNFGISYNTLFPDLDGIAKTINYQYLNHKPY